MLALVLFFIVVTVSATDCDYHAAVADAVVVDAVADAVADAMADDVADDVVVGMVGAEVVAVADAVVADAVVAAAVAVAQLDALDNSRLWEDARRRCEVWAFKLDSCNCQSGRMALAGFAGGAGPPRASVRAMHASLQEGYCKALR